MQDKSLSKLFEIVRAAVVLRVEEHTPAVVLALDELERRTATNLLERLERACEDVAAFKASHAVHVHPIHYGPPGEKPIPLARTLEHVEHGPSAQQVRCAHNTVSKLSGRCKNCNLFVHLPIADMRTNAENRAWRVIEEWITSAPKKPEHSGSTYEVRTSPVSPGHGTDWDAAIWRGFWNEAKDELDSEVVSTKRGTSRLDALAHLASWCEEDMHPLVEVSNATARVGVERPDRR